MKTCFVILKILADKKFKIIDYVPQKCLRDNKVPLGEYVKDWLSPESRPVKNNCSILCYFFNLDILDKDGKSLMPPLQDNDFPCIVTEKDRCNRAYKQARCLFGPDGPI